MPEKQLDTQPTFPEMMDTLKAQGKKPTIKDMLRMKAAPILGAMVEVSSLDPEVREHPGLIALDDGGRLVSPVFQFENTENGRKHLNPRLANTWILFKLLQIDQVKEDEWSTAARLNRSNPSFDGRTTAEALMDPGTPDTTVNQFYTEIIEDAVRFGQVHGIRVVDPRTRLPQAQTSEADQTLGATYTMLQLPSVK